MDKYRQTGIKELIAAHPAVGDILERYDIACVPCTVGTCKLADVVKFHPLSPARRARLEWELERCLYPDRALPPPVAPSEEPLAAPTLSYSPPVRRLVEEHAWITRMLTVLPALLEDIRRTGSFDADLLTRVLDFIRGYADRFHHRKEEDILFDYADKDEEIIKVIYQDHDQARGYIRAAAAAVDQGDSAGLSRALHGYRELLTEHIRKEDTVLYPYLDRGLSTSQVGELFRRFEEADATAGPDTPGKYLRFVEGLERRFGRPTGENSKT